MQDVLTMAEGLKRPKLLVRAARFGLSFYRREKDLSRLLQEPVSQKSRRHLMQLMETEAFLETERRQGGDGYSAPYHIEVLTAVMAEARRFRAEAAC